MAKVDGGVVLLPMTAGEIVLAYNLDGVSELKLPRDVYPKIFLGEITKWNDEAKSPLPMTASTFPTKNITVVVRADSSGTNFNFTNHLSAISNGFQKHGWRRQDRSVAEGFELHRRSGQPGHHRHGQADPRRHRLHRIWLRPADQHALRHA